MVIYRVFIYIIYVFVCQKFIQAKYNLVFSRNTHLVNYCCYIVYVLLQSYLLSTWNSYFSYSIRYVRQNINYGEEVEQLKVYARQQSQQKKKRRKNKVRGEIDLKQIQSLNRQSYCFKCDVVKEKRVHHCSVCKKCIIRMDHHCPWVGNCVGKYNHKYFILFLLYATTGLTMITVSIILDYFTGCYYANLLGSQNEIIWLYINCLTSGIVGLLIGFLFVTQMMTVTQNITTLQSFTEGIKERNPWKYDSVVDNLRQIFGEGNWLLPTNPFPNSPKHSMCTMQEVAL